MFSANYSWLMTSLIFAGWVCVINRQIGLIDPQILVNIQCYTNILLIMFVSYSYVQKCSKMSTIMTIESARAHYNGWQNHPRVKRGLVDPILQSKWFDFIIQALLFKSCVRHIHTFENYSIMILFLYFVGAVHNIFSLCNSYFHISQFSAPFPSVGSFQK